MIRRSIVDNQGPVRRTDIGTEEQCIEEQREGGGGAEGRPDGWTDGWREGAARCQQLEDLYKYNLVAELPRN